ncbi:Replication factor A protein [Spatholobus suberectus]|nr:Replication factor A protein [Spatholobus suberectus]
MSSSTNAFHMVSEIAFGFESWLIKLKGSRIQATVKKEVVKLFKCKMIKNGVYFVRNLSIARNDGFTHVIAYGYRLIFQHRTDVTIVDDDFVSNIGLNLTSCSHIVAQKANIDYLVDFMGMIIAVSTERELFRAFRVKSFINMEVKDST